MIRYSLVIMMREVLPNPVDDIVYTKGQNGEGGNSHENGEEEEVGHALLEYANDDAIDRHSHGCNDAGVTYMDDMILSPIHDLGLVVEQCPSERCPSVCLSVWPSLSLLWFLSISLSLSISFCLSPSPFHSVF